jgi:class 3 adenylate cyclase
MFNNSDLTISEYSGPAGTQRVFLLRIDVIETASAKSADQETLGKLVRRRLKRIERTLGNRAGTLVHALPNGLLAAFDTAEAAIHGACDMQRCCAAIPQIPGTRIGIRIGIDVGPADQRKATTASAAARLAACGGMDHIVVSKEVADAMPAALRRKTSPLTLDDPAASVLSFDWQNTVLPPVPIPVENRAPAARPGASPRTTRIELRLNGETLRFPGNRRIITIGRDTTNDIVIDSPEVSRKHCRIVIQNDSYVLVDESTNGTYISPDQGAPLHLKRKMATLAGAGWIALGHLHDRSSKRVVEFIVRKGTS